MGKKSFISLLKFVGGEDCSSNLLGHFCAGRIVLLSMLRSHIMGCQWECVPCAILKVPGTALKTNSHKEHALNLVGWN